MSRQLIYDPSNPTSTQTQIGGGVDQTTYQNIRQQVGTQVLEQGGKLTDIKTALDLLKPEEMSDQQKTDIALAQRLSVLESLWFPNENKLALPAQTNLIGRQIHKLQKMFEASSEYELFRRYAKTMGAALAKKAGDTGNIAWAEQANQLQALADADLTKEEAQSAFENIRAGLGISKPPEYYDTLRQGVVPPEIEGLSYKTLKPANIDTPIKPQPIQKSTEEKAVDLADLSTLQRLFGTTEQTYKPNLPGAQYGGELGMLAGPTVGKFTGLPPGLRTLLTGSIGQTYENIGREGIPLTRQAVQQQGYGSPVGMLAGPLGVLATEPRSRKMLAQTAPAALLDLLFSGHEILGKGKVAEAQRIGKVGGTEISKSYLKTIKELLGQGKDLEKETARITAKYAEPEAATSLLKRKAFLGETSRKVSGGLKSTRAAALQDEERRLIREALHNRSNLITGLDKIDELLYGIGGAGRELAGRIVGPALGAVGFYLGSKAAGQGRD